MEPFGALRAIVWAQWRTSRNFIRSANKASLAVQWAIMAIWYGGWIVGAIAAGVFVSGPATLSILEFLLPLGLFVMFTFWQVMPVIAASQGGVIDLRRLLAFPIPSNQLFFLEVVLRITTAPEMLLLCVGLIGGLAWNRQVPFWGPLALLPYIAFNLLLAAGIKSLLERVLRRKGIRELVVFGFVALTLLPQLLEFTRPAPGPKDFGWVNAAFPLLQLLPWSAAAQLALGRFSVLAFLALLFWPGFAYTVSRRLFARSLQLTETTAAPEKSPAAPSEWRERLLRWPAALLPDPLAAIAEKDFRSLLRSSRFRLTFLMASAMGALLWLPAVLRSPGGWMAANYLTMTALYGTLVLGDTLYWNVFGFERASVQQWFVTPVTFRQALLAKNVVSVAFSLLAVVAQSLLAYLLPVHAGPAAFVDALATIAVFLPVLLGGGNLASVYTPRPADPNDAWRNTGGKSQLLLFIVFPLLTIPPTLAYLARWAMDCYWIYHAVMGTAFLAGLCFYIAATDAASEAGEERKEQIAAALSHTEGPVSTGI